MTEIKKEIKLFEKGKPSVYGWASGGIVDYNLSDGKIKPFSLKEWDFYQIQSERRCMQITLGHVSYCTSVNLTYMDFGTGKRIEVGKMLPLKRIALDENADKDSEVIYSDRDIAFTFKRFDGKRLLTVKGTDKRVGEVDVELLLEKSDCTVLVCTPFEKSNQFYLNEKINLMGADGHAVLGETEISFDKKTDFALLDWGRGVLPFSHEWIWASASGLSDGKRIGFNLGKFGNAEKSSENVVYFDGKSEHYDEVNISLDKTDYMSEWKFSSTDGKMELTLSPVFDNFTTTKLLFVDNGCHQVFGRWNGYFTVDGEKIEVKELFGFSENARNHW